MPKKLDDDVKERVAQLLLEGKTLESVAEEAGVGRSTVARIKKDLLMTKEPTGDPVRRGRPLKDKPRPATAQLAELKAAALAVLDAVDMPMGHDRQHRLALAAASLRRLMSDGGMIKFLSSEEQEHLASVLNVQMAKAVKVPMADKADWIKRCGELERENRELAEQLQRAASTIERAADDAVADGDAVDGGFVEDLKDHIVALSMEEHRLRRVLAAKEAR